MFFFLFVCEVLNDEFVKYPDIVPNCILHKNQQKKNVFALGL